MDPAGGKHCPSLAAVGRRRGGNIATGSWSPLLSSQIRWGVMDRKRDGKGAGSVVTDVLPLLPAPRSCLRAGNSRQPRIRAIPGFVRGNHHQPPSALSSPFSLCFPCFLSSYLLWLCPPWLQVPDFWDQTSPSLPFLLPWEYRSVVKAWYELSMLLSSPVLPQPGLPTSSHFSLLPEIISKCQKQILT